jgi:hypothetical protein
MLWLKEKLDDLWVGAVVPAIAVFVMAGAVAAVVIVFVRWLGLDLSDLERGWPD